MNFKEAEQRIERVASGKAVLWVDRISFEERKIEQETCIVALISPTHHVYCDLPSEILSQIDIPAPRFPGQRMYQSDLRGSMYGLDSDDAKGLVIKRESDALWARVWQDFLIYFPFAFYPPIFFLIIFLLGFWVSRGFREKS